MPDEIKLIITGDAAGAVDAVKQLNSALATTAPAAQQVQAAWLGMPETLNKVGGATQGLEANYMTLHRSAYVAVSGLDAAFAGTTGSTAKLASEIGGATSRVAGLVAGIDYLGPTALALTATFAAAGFIISQLSEAEEKATADATTLNTALEDMKKTDATANALARLAGVTTDQAKAALDAAKANPQYRDALIALGKAAGDSVDPINTYKQAIWDADAAVKGSWLYSVTPQVGTFGLILPAITRTTDAQLKLNAAVKGGAAEEDAYGRLMHKDRAQETADLETFDKLAKDRDDAQRKAEEDALKHSEAYANALETVQKAQENILRGAVEKALTPTTVSETDMAAAALGKYNDKWDEFRRRVEAVVKGTDPAKFGAQFQAALAGMHMPLDQVIEGFKDLSIFADPKNLKLVDWGAVTTDIGHQLLELVGKANLMKEGFAKAWASLSVSQKTSLRELGIESSADAKKVLMGTADSGVAGFVGQIGDKATQAKLATAGNAVVKAVQQGMTMPDTVKTWTGTMDSVVQAAMTSLADKKIIAELMDGGKSVIQSISDGIIKNEGILSNALWAACDDAVQKAIKNLQSKYPPPPPPGGSGNSKQFGGFGIARAGETFTADKGEGYWFSGANWNVPPPGRSRSGGSEIIVVNINSPVSLATRAEAEQIIAPYVRAAVRNAKQRGAS